MDYEYENNIHLLAAQYGQHLLASQRRCVVAESCTGGLLAAALTDIPGSSQWFDCGFVTYSSQAKANILHIPVALLQQEGSVSEATACAMAEGALHVCDDADVSIAITGFAGPDGGSATQPVGTVWIACSGRHQETLATCYYFQGDRTHIRQQAVYAALQLAYQND